MSAPDAGSPSHQEGPLDTRGSTAGISCSCGQPQDDEELFQFVRDLVNVGPRHPCNVRIRDELWDTRPTITRVRNLLENDPNSIFERLGNDSGRPATTVRQVAERECTLFDRNLTIDAVSEFHRLVAEKLGVPLTEWYTVVDRNTAINIMRRTAQSKRDREIVSRLWPTITDTAVMKEAFDSVHANGKAPFSDHWDRKGLAVNHKNMVNVYRFYAGQAGLRVTDICSVDTQPAPSRLEEHQEFPVEEWRDAVTATGLGARPADNSQIDDRSHEPAWDEAGDFSEPEAPDDAWNICDDTPWPKGPD